MAPKSFYFEKYWGIWVSILNIEEIKFEAFFPRRKIALLQSSMQNKREGESVCVCVRERERERECERERGKNLSDIKIRCLYTGGNRVINSPWRKKTSILSWSLVEHRSLFLSFNLSFTF